LDIRDLRYFVAIVEEGSFSRAALRLRVAQPALSLKVRKLEASLKTQLLLRGPHGVQPTDAGKLLLLRARAIVTDLSRAEAEIRSLGQKTSGTVRIGLPGTISGILSVPLIARTRKNYPEIKIIIVEAMSGFVREWLNEGRVDMAILYMEKSEPSIVSKPLLREELVVLISKDASLNFLNARDALLNMPLILPTNTHGLRNMVEHKLRMMNLFSDPTIEVDSYSNIKDLVASDYGCSILPYHAISGDVASGKLAYVGFEDAPIWRIAHLVHHSSRPMTSAYLAVLDNLISTVDDLIRNKVWEGAERL
jgi:LysR family nitrogen assimilation transcriptional regulator